MSRLFIFRGILLVGILPRNILLRGIFLWRDFSVEGFGERNFPAEFFFSWRDLAPQPFNILHENAPTYLLLPLGKRGSKWGDFHWAMGCV